MLISMIVSSSGCLYDLLTFVYESASLIPKIPRETAWNGDSKGIEKCPSIQRGSYLSTSKN